MLLRLELPHLRIIQFGYPTKDWKDFSKNFKYADFDIEGIACDDSIT